MIAIFTRFDLYPDKKGLYRQALRVVVMDPISLKIAATSRNLERNGTDC